MKKIKKSFADRARELQKRYSKANFDKIEADELEAEMEKLLNEQEMVRSAMGLNEQPQQVQQFDKGGPVKPYSEYTFSEQYERDMNPGFNFMFNPLNPYNKIDRTKANPLFNSYNTNFSIPGLSNTPKNGVIPVLPVDAISSANMPLKKAQSTKPTFKGGNKPTNIAPLIKPELVDDNIQRERLNFQYHGNMGNGITPLSATTGMNKLEIPNKLPLETNKLKAWGDSQVEKAKGMESFWNKNKQYLPQAIGGLSNIAGNLLLAAMSKKSPQITPSLAYAEKINLEPKAEQLRRDANVSKNVGLANARNLGLSPGATLANMGSIGAGIDRNLGANLTDLYMGQEQVNVGATNQFALQNQDAINRVNMINSQMKFQKEDDRMNYIAQALSVPANIAREISMAKSDKQMKDILDRYYQSMGRNYQTLGSVYGENAFTTKVRQ